MLKEKKNLSELFFQMVKRRLGLPSTPMIPDHWKLSLLTIESIYQAVRFFYNFIRILRQQHFRSSAALFQEKGSKRRCHEYDKGAGPYLLNSTCIEHLGVLAQHPGGHSPSTQAFKIISRQHLANALNTFVTTHPQWNTNGFSPEVTDWGHTDLFILTSSLWEESKLDLSHHWARKIEEAAVEGLVLTLPFPSRPAPEAEASIRTSQYQAR